MKFAEFFSQIRADGIEIEFDYTHGSPPPRLNNEAMFHLPLIAITILMISKGHVKPASEEIGQLIGDCYERTFPGFRGSAQHLGWSASLRVRTVQALAFLEQAELVEVDSTSKKISATAAGRSVIDRAISASGDLASNLISVERSYRNIRTERQLRLSPA
ncbi:hypothetical protein [Lysobacter sp. Root690]|uniref:hypothetical protein n=1 Tax=Lysobacter sp. Root690 TaxID=1736588 RepID=UPI0006FE9D7B|nr:hypothetical protein [Lysobacter sp. Root690]KRB08071.1 hypothetical protein ASD86_09770 [Lysobacter sp. Root690]